MPLSTSVPRAQAYTETHSVLFDTSAFTWFAGAEGGMSKLGRVIGTYRVLVPTPVLYELAFGLEGSVGHNEAEIRELIWDPDPTKCMDLTAYHIAKHRNLLPAAGVLIINPGFNEWWVARRRLLTYVEQARAQPGKAKRVHSMDALIHALARNFFAPVCTKDLDDFGKLNRAGAAYHHDGPVPLFHPSEIVRSLDEAVHYEFNGPPAA